MVVDDDDGFRELMHTILTNEGFAVDKARSGEEAIRKARAKSYDLILLDLKMTGIDGMEVLKILKPECPTTDFIMVTGYGDVDIAVELIKLGAKEYVRKPVEPSEFIQRIRASLRAHAAELRVREIQSEFSSRLLHNLRGPLVTMNSAIDFLKKEGAGALSAEQRKVIEEMSLNSAKMDALLNDMIDLTLFESGKVTLDKLPVNLDVVIPNAVDRIIARAKAKNISVNVNIADGIPTIELDPEKIEQVLQNVLDNAVKYSRDGGSITVGLSLRKHVFSGKSAESVEISVTDTGVGIPKEELPLIFDKYKDVLTGKSSSLKTTGLGLAICRSIVEAHGGNMTAASDVNKGTTIAIYFPTEAG